MGVDSYDLPTSCGMPDLGRLRQLSLSFIMLSMFTGHGPKEHLALAAWTNFIRLVDKALADYKLARDCLQAYLGTSDEAGLWHIIMMGAHLVRISAVREHADRSIVNSRIGPS